MDEPFDSKNDRASGDLYGRIETLVGKRPRAWQSTCAVIGLAGGALSPFLGALLVALAWLTHSAGATPVLNILSIVSFTLTIPLLTFGGHCLDLLEAKAAALSPPFGGTPCATRVRCC